MKGPYKGYLKITMRGILIYTLRGTFKGTLKIPYRSTSYKPVKEPLKEVCSSLIEFLFIYFQEPCKEPSYTEARDRLRKVFLCVHLSSPRPEGHGSEPPEAGSCCSGWVWRV